MKVTQALDLGFNPNQPRDSQGQWTQSSPGVYVIPTNVANSVAQYDATGGLAYMGSGWDGIVWREPETAEDRWSRVKSLVKSSDYDPIEILGPGTGSRDFMIPDGNHRVAAARDLGVPSVRARMNKDTAAALAKKYRKTEFKPKMRSTKKLLEDVRDMLRPDAPGSVAEIQSLAWEAKQHSDPAVRAAGEALWNTYVRGQTASANGVEEFGDFLGHPFRGNQHTGRLSVKFEGPDFLVDAAADWKKRKGIETLDFDYDHVGTSMKDMKEISDAYDALPMSDPSAEKAYAAMVKEIEEQYDFVTKELGIKVEIVTEDPYPSVEAMARDVAENHRIKAFATSETGSHPYFSDAQNDKFRAVHDLFGHAAIGRGFDRNGEEAAWLSHSQMFSPEARRAMTTETRGQNASLNAGGKNEFPPQKLALLPERFSDIPIDIRHPLVAALVSIALALEGADRRYCVAGGRAYLDWVTNGPLAPPKHGEFSVLQVVELFNPNQARDSKGMWTDGPGEGMFIGDTMRGEDNRDIIGEYLNPHWDTDDVTEQERGEAKATLVNNLADGILKDAQGLTGTPPGTSDLLLQLREAYGDPADTGRFDDPEYDEDGNMIVSDAHAAKRAAQEYVDSWMQTAADHDGMALALQDTVADEFDATSSSFEEYSKGINFREPIKEFRKSEGRVMEAFVHASYNQTQAQLRRLGIGPNDPVTLYRGMGINAPVSGTHPIDLNPVSSWTTNKATAAQFAVGSSQEGAEGPRVLTMTVPVVPCNLHEVIEGCVDLLG